ncbi:MAG: dihydroxy-acid dehydratase [Candidatus Handelsmanbacteria bacterium]|nr:dihydroxy-acid dehydratase [Candidatus Handelsmanbacteria bacterium]
MHPESGLRSAGWFARQDMAGFVARGWLKNQGHPDQMFNGRPVIGIANTWSDLNPCNASLRILAEQVKRGVYEAGGLPLEFPVLSLGETLMKPTTMLYRNLASMEVEETLRANPLDGVVLLTGCDKTTPACLMGACSVDLPTLVLTSGPMLNGKFRGRDIGSGTDVYRFTAELRAGTMSQTEYLEAEGAISRSEGHCMTMGTASTMACMVEALGLTLPSGAAVPAADSRRRRLGHLAGNRIVAMVREDLRLSRILTRRAFENAIKVNAAIGGSTNFVVHLLAIAGRIGVPLSLEDFDRLGSHLPLLANLMPSGQYLMEDFFYAGGLPALIAELGEELDQGALTVTGRTLAENNAGAQCYNREVIASRDQPIKRAAGIAVLRGNLCPDGAIIKPSAASPHLMKHRGRAVVFADIEDYHARLDDPGLDVDESCVLVLKGIGPRGFPGMPEAGKLNLPRKLLEKGVRDMVCISDGRMSGTAYGTIVLHVAPEAAVGGPLALVQDGDFIELDVAARRLHLDLPEAELARRRQTWEPPAPRQERGYARLYTDHVLQADRGADLDFLVGGSGSQVYREYR